ncbi:hypothetical protein Y88_3411 [Novosphingobium nitrogenifigens DSM 19370]|uniref:Uncharacterized protein n=1 Tax=Novosphingobium nitrogenifigens DSM 19370 TaxID=983920 RepID=F1Z3A8_9SPHN|nr:hypothetical protein Y88_3411 [Novosphingobium nitrogenifigens DSM 19370]
MQLHERPIVALQHGTEPSFSNCRNLIFDGIDDWSSTGQPLES